MNDTESRLRTPPPCIGATRRLLRLAVVVALCANSTAAVAQVSTTPASPGSTLDSLLKVNARAVSLSAGRLAGPGVEYLMQEVRDAQFVSIGERHDIREITEFASALLHALHRTSGFNHLATENGAYTMRRLTGSRSGGPFAAEFVNRFPNALEFGNDDDLTFYEDASRLLARKTPGVWGLDQEFGATHLLDRLSELAPSKAARSAVDSLLESVRPAESKNFAYGGVHWMGRNAKPETFRRLAALFPDRVPSEARTILAALEMSARLYDLNRRAAAGERTGFDANNEREEYLKRNFVDHYRNAVARGERLPKVMLKLGQAHLTRGQSPFGPFALGNLLAEFATANGTKAVNIFAVAHNARADSLAPSLWKWADMRPLAEALPTDQITLVDLRPLRAFLYSGRLGTVGADLRRTIYGYDFALVVGGAHEASEGVLSKADARAMAQKRPASTRPSCVSTTRLCRAPIE